MSLVIEVYHFKDFLPLRALSMAASTLLYRLQLVLLTKYNITPSAAAEFAGSFCLKAHFAPLTTFFMLRGCGGTLKILTCQFIDIS